MNGAWECKNGHRFDEENTYVHPDGHKRCRACNRDEQNRRRLQNQSDDMAAKRGTHVPVTIMPRPVSYDTEAWRERAACATIGGDLWFPNKGDNGVTARAKEICASCPAIMRCLEEGMNEEHGVWGGTTPEERRKLRRAKSA